MNVVIGLPWKKYGMSCFQLLRKKVHHYIISVWFRLQLFAAFLLYAHNSWSMEHNLSQWHGFVKKPSFWNNITIRCFIYALLFGDEWSCLHCDVWCPYLVLSLSSSFFYLFKYIAHTLMLGCQGWDLDAVSCIVKLFPLIFGVIRQTLSSFDYFIESSMKSIHSVLSVVNLCRDLQLKLFEIIQRFWTFS